MKDDLFIAHQSVHGKHLDNEYYLALIMKEMNINKDQRLYNKDKIISRFIKIIEELNLNYYKEYDKDVEIIFLNIKNRILYERLAENGPKVGKISES